MKQKIDLSVLSREDLQAALAEKEKAEKANYEAAKKMLSKDKEDFCEAIARKFKQQQVELRELKQHAIREANCLDMRMYEIEGKERKERKEMSVTNAANTVKVVVSSQDRFVFTDEAIVHINAIKEIFYEKFAQRNKGLYNLLDSLLIKNTKKEYDPKLLTKARGQIRALGDTTLIEEFDKLEDCQRVVGTALYCRVYVRDEKSQKWQDISLQFSGL